MHASTAIAPKLSWVWTVFLIFVMAIITVTAADVITDDSADTSCGGG